MKMAMHLLKKSDKIMRKKIFQKSLILLIILFFSLVIIFLQKILNSNQSINNYYVLIQGKTTEHKERNVDLKEKLGQNLIVGIPGYTIDEKTKKILSYIKPAGIVLYRRNYKSDLQFKNLIFQLQKISKEDTGFFYFIMLDEEPDGANRIGLLKNVFSLGLPDWIKIEKDIITLSNIGINVLLAPVSDFTFNDNSFVQRRIVAKTPEDLMAFNRTFIKLLKRHNISATLKHFPGMGFFIEDSHKGIPSLNIQQEIFNKSLEIFGDGINNGADFVMTGHAIYSNIDNNISTFSSKIVRDILINHLDFRGIIITDDLSDMFLTLKKIDPADAGIRALKAGHHLIMYSHKLENTKDIFDKIFNYANKDHNLRFIIEKNYQKIISLKKSLLLY